MTELCPAEGVLDAQGVIAGCLIISECKTAKLDSPAVGATVNGELISCVLGNDAADAASGGISAAAGEALQKLGLDSYSFAMNPTGLLLKELELWDGENVRKITARGGEFAQNIGLDFDLKKLFGDKAANVFDLKGTVFQMIKFMDGDLGQDKVNAISKRGAHIGEIVDALVSNVEFSMDGKLDSTLKLGGMTNGVLDDIKLDLASVDMMLSTTENHDGSDLEDFYDGIYIYAQGQSADSLVLQMMEQILQKHSYALDTVFKGTDVAENIIKNLQSGSDKSKLGLVINTEKAAFTLGMPLYTGALKKLPPFNLFDIPDSFEVNCHIKFPNNQFGFKYNDEHNDMSCQFNIDLGYAKWLRSILSTAPTLSSWAIREVEHVFADEGRVIASALMGAWGAAEKLTQNIVDDAAHTIDQVWQDGEHVTQDVVDWAHERLHIIG